MEQVTLFFTAMITALAVENTIFARGLGLSKKVLFPEGAKAGLLYGLLMTWIVTVSSIPIAWINLLFYRAIPTQNLLFLTAPMYLLCVCAVFAFTDYAAHRWLPDRYPEIRRALPITTFNTALFSVFYITYSQSYGFLQTFGYALGAGVGYTLAIQIIYFARKRLAISPVPRSFRGLPILLIYIGLLSLAIYGLIGHGLPI